MSQYTQVDNRDLEILEKLASRKKKKPLFDIFFALALAGVSLIVGYWTAVPDGDPTKNLIFYTIIPILTACCLVASIYEYRNDNRNESDVSEFIAIIIKKYRK